MQKGQLPTLDSVGCRPMCARTQSSPTTPTRGTTLGLSNGMHLLHLVIVHDLLSRRWYFGFEVHVNL
jgi:hypothetical protein